MANGLNPVSSSSPASAAPSTFPISDTANSAMDAFLAERFAEIAEGRSPSHHLAAERYVDAEGADLPAADTMAKLFGEALRDSEESPFNANELLAALETIEVLQTVPATEITQYQQVEIFHQTIYKNLCASLVYFNFFFQTLLNQSKDALPGWLKQESQKDKFKFYRPFYLSSFLLRKLPILEQVRSSIPVDIYHKWSTNYPLAIQRLEECRLQTYNEQVSTEEETMMKTCFDEVEGHNQIRQDLSLQEAFNKFLDSTLPFYREIIRLGHDFSAIKTCVAAEKQKPHYAKGFLSRHFFTNLLSYMVMWKVEIDVKRVDEWNDLDFRCEYILSQDPELTLLLTEAPVSAEITMMKNILQTGVLQQKAMLDTTLSESTLFFRDLRELLEQEPSAENRKRVEILLASVGNFIFFTARNLKSVIFISKNLLDEKAFSEFSMLFSFCCAKLIEGNYQFPSYGEMFEIMANQHAQMGIPAASPVFSPQAASQPPAAASAALTSNEEIQSDSKFYRQMLDQKDADVEAWLNAHQGSEVLSRGSRLVPRYKEVLKIVDRDTVRNWRECYNACIEKLQLASLSHLIPKKG